MFLLELDRVNLGDRLMGVLAQTEPGGAVQEIRLEDRLEDQLRRRLNDPVLDRENSRRP